MTTSPPHVFFAHGNGFPAPVYQPMLSAISAEISTIGCLGMNPDYPITAGYSAIADEIIHHIQNHCSSPVTGVGHSGGALALLMAAKKQPDIFNDLVLFDPVLFNPGKRLLIQLITLLGLIDKVGPSGKAQTRRDQFNSKEEAIARWENRGFYTQLDPRVFDLYIQHGLVKSDGRITLRIPRGIEAEFFRQVRSIDALGNLRNFSGLVVLPSKSNFVTPIDRWCWQLPNSQFETQSPEAGHMYPLTHPEQAAQHVNQRLK